MAAKVATKFSTYPVDIRTKLEYLRQFIFEVASQTNEVGQLEETLKWGQPSYLTSESKSGSTIRIDWISKSPSQYAIYLNCNTSLVDSYRTLFPELNYYGQRAIVFDIKEPLPEKPLRVCISMALRYHLDKPKL